MSEGIAYFAPDFTGSQEAALRFIVDHQLAPSVLARSAFCERAIGNAIQIGCSQIAVFALVIPKKSTVCDSNFAVCHTLAMPPGYIF